MSMYYHYRGKGSRLRRGRIRSLDSSRCHPFPMFNGEYLVAEAIQEAILVYSFVFGNDALYERFRLLHLSY